MAYEAVAPDKISVSNGRTLEEYGKILSTPAEVISC